MNLQRIIKKGVTDQSIVIRIVDSVDGSPEEAVEHNTAGIALWYRREGATKTAITPVALAALDTAHTDGGIEHIDDGYYRLDPPDAAFATGANGVSFGGTLTGMVVVGCYAQLSDIDIQDAVRGGMTALPNAAADAAGGLPISDAGGLDLDKAFSSIPRVWFVDNVTDGAGDLGTREAPFDSFSAAQTAASDGDTIILIGTAVSYGAITISKRLRVIGTGSGVEEGVGGAPLTGTTQVGNITISNSNITLENFYSTDIQNANGHQHIVTRGLYVAGTSDCVVMTNGATWIDYGSILLASGDAILSTLATYIELNGTHVEVQCSTGVNVNCVLQSSNGVVKFRARGATFKASRSTDNDAFHTTCFNGAGDYTFEDCNFFTETTHATHTGAAYIFLSQTAWAANTNISVRGGSSKTTKASGSGTDRTWDVNSSNVRLTLANHITDTTKINGTRGTHWDYPDQAIHPATSGRPLLVNASGHVERVTLADALTANNDKTGYALSAGGVTAVQSGLATPTNITAGTITTVTNRVTANTDQIEGTDATNYYDTLLQQLNDDAASAVAYAREAKSAAMNTQGKELGPVAYTTGIATVKGILFRAGQVRNVVANTWVAWNDADIANYVIALTETGTSGQYFASTPTGVSLDDEMELLVFAGATSLANIQGPIAKRRVGNQGSAIKTKTDQLVFTVANQVDANALTGGGGGSADVPTTLQATTIATLASQTSFTLAAGSADNDAYNDCLAIFTDRPTPPAWFSSHIGTHLPLWQYHYDALTL